MEALALDRGGNLMENDMRDKLTDIIGTHSEFTRSQDSCVADDIIDALPTMVVPLVWALHSPDDQPFWSANEYVIQSMPRDTWQFMGRPYVHIGEAKAAAQAHHVAQIMAAFGINA